MAAKHPTVRSAISPGAKPLYARYALLLLMVIFFLVPFAMRGARMAVQRMKNDVKDWLPADFPETAELEWFRDHFLGEQFAVVSWEGCTGQVDDESYMTFVDKFFPEVPPSIRQLRAAEKDQTPSATAASSTSRSAIEGQEDVTAREAPVDGDPQRWPVEVRREAFTDADLGLYVRQLKLGDLPPEEAFIGNRLHLFYTGKDHFDWAGHREKWITGIGQQWFYITPEGDLYRWRGSASALAPVINYFKRKTGGGKLTGEFVASLGPLDGPWFYANPQRLNARMFKTVTTGPGLLHELTRPGGVLEGDVAEARRRLSSVLFGPDGRQTCLVLTLTDAAREELTRAFGRGVPGKYRGLLMQMAEHSGIHAPGKPNLLPPPLDYLFTSTPPPSGPLLRMGGPPIDNVAIDEEGQVTLIRLVGLSLAVGIGLSWLSFRSVAATTMVFVVGGLAAVSSLSIVFWSGKSVDAVLMSMPSLVYVLGLSAAIHIMNYYRDAVRSGELISAPGRAIAMGWRPCFLAALTTALGLLSLSTSNILPIRKFGVFSAVGVMFTLLLLFTYLPAALQVWPPKRFRLTAGRSQKAASSWIESRIEAFWQAMGGWVVRRHVLVAVLCLLTMGSVGYGLTRINTDIQLLKMFDADAKIIEDYKWLEQNLGKLVPMEIVVRVRPEMMRDTELSDTTEAIPADEMADSLAQLRQLTFLERMEIAYYIQEVLEHQFGAGDAPIIGRTMSAATFAPELPGPGGGLLKIAERGGINRRLWAHRDEFLGSDYLRIDRVDGSELWRVSLRLAALSDVDYGQFVEDLKQSVEPLLAAYDARDRILATLAEHYPDGKLRGRSIYLAGAPLGPSRSARVRRDASPSDRSPQQRPADPSGSPAADSSDQPNGPSADRTFRSHREDVPGPVQTAIFSKILARLLVNTGLRIGDWYDPRYEPPENWDAVLAKHDLVALVDPDWDPEGQWVTQTAPVTVDVRDHRYQPGSPTAKELDQSISCIYTGVVPVVYKAQRTLLVSLVESTGWAFVMIAGVMVVVLRSLRGGVLSMLPNVFPVVIIFGAMGWTDVMVDIGTMMTASVAMGVAVDDTIHFLTWFRHGLDEGLERESAILYAYQRCGTAMTQTTLIGGLGLSIFAFSTFTPTQRFGILMLTLLTAALIGDLIFLPALLASPLGRIFRRRGHRSDREESRDKSTGPQDPTAQDPMPQGNAPANTAARSATHWSLGGKRSPR